MNKKFLSAILFGALAVASTGSFVSCQDYDDEIDNLQTQINGLASAKDLADKVSELQAAIAAAKEAATKEASEEAKKAVEKLEQLSKELDKAMEELKNATEDQMDAISKKVAAFEDEVNAAVEGFAKSLKSIVFQPELYIDGIEAAKYTYLKYAALTVGKDQYGFTGVQKNDLGNVVKLLAKAPEGYTIDSYLHDGNLLFNIDPASSEKKPGTTNDYAGKDMYVGVEDSVKFAVNPANAVITKDQAKLIAKNVVASTRANHDTDPKIELTKDPVNVNGIITVYYLVSNPEALISANHAEGAAHPEADHKNTTMFHAEITNSDEAKIESDWAMLYENAVQPVAIAWNKDGNAKASQKAAYCGTDKLFPELYKNPYEALENPASLALGYTDEGYDLYDLIELHMIGLCEDTKICDKMVFHNDDALNEEAKNHKAITLADAEAKYGLTVKFTPVAYETEAAGNKTQPTNYINPALGAKGKVVAGIVDAATGKFDAQQGPSSVGKQPLVQVLVMKGKDVVLEGYIKLVITRSTKSKLTPAIDLGKKDFKCDGLDYAMSWSQASTLVLEQTMEMGKSEFDANYKLVTLGEEEKCAKLYTGLKLDKDGFVTEATEVEVKNMYLLAYEGVDPESTTNTVLHVALDKYAQQYILEEKGGKDTIYVKYAPATGKDEVHQYEPGVFVEMIIEVKNTPEVLKMEKKIAEYWYKTGVEVNGESTSEKSATELNTLRLNVNKPDDHMNTYNLNQPMFKGAEVEGFVRDVRSAFEVHKGNNDVVLTKDGKPYASTYEEEAQERTKFYFHPAINGTKFTGDDNVEYALSVDYDYVICDKWIAGDGPEAIVAGVKESHRQPKDILTHKIEKISEKPLNFVEELTQNHKVSVVDNLGIFKNTKLYVTINKVKTQVAELDPTTGEIYYNHSEAAQQLLNATSWAKAKAKSYVGVYSTNACGDVLAVTDGVFPAYFLRPLDMDPAKVDSVTDATANGSIAKLTKIATFKDWREVEITPAKNGWLLAYYGVGKVTIDLKNMKTDMNGYKFTKKLSEVTKDAKFTLINNAGTVLATMESDPYVKTAADLSAYNFEAAPSAKVFEEVFGDLAIKYENNGLNVYNWSVQIPVKIGYDWGEFTTYVTVKVVKTLGTQD